MAYQDTLLKLPGTTQFLDRLVDDVRQRRSVVVAVPSPFQRAALRSMLHYRLTSLDFDVHDVSLGMVGEDTSPIAVLSQLLHVDWEPGVARTPAALIARLPEGAPPLDVIQVIGIEDLSPSDRLLWVQMFDAWAVASHSLMDQGRDPVVLVAVLPVSGAQDMPKPNMHLAIHWLWGTTSALEARLFCRLKQRGEQLDPASRWREYVLSSLAAGDLSLIEFLWDDACGDVPALTERLCAFAEERGWTEGVLQDVDLRTLSSPNGHHNSRPFHAPPPDALPMWARGAVYMTMEYGVEAHPSILALYGMHEQIAHRIWRGQAELVLPLIDQVRLALCDSLTRKYGEDWPTRWELPDSVEQQEAVMKSPLAAEWGYLNWLLKMRSELSAESRWSPVAASARRLRNQLAHYQPVAYHEFERFLQQTRLVMNGVGV